MLPNGSYDVIVVDATTDGDGLALDLAVLAGPHKGEMASLHATGLAIGELDALGLPGTLVVENGVPRVTLEP